MGLLKNPVHLWTSYLEVVHSKLIGLTELACDSDQNTSS